MESSTQRLQNDVCVCWVVGGQVNEITAELKSLKSELDQHTKDSSQYGQVGHTKSFSDSSNHFLTHQTEIGIGIDSNLLLSGGIIMWQPHPSHCEALRCLCHMLKESDAVCGAV